MTVKGNKTAGAVIYTRVSTGEQAEHGTSLESQRDACRQKALALGLPIVAEYEDAGVSGGFLLTRQGMMAAIADLQAGRADTLICANVSRYSRDVEHQQALLKSVRAAGGHLVFCDATFEDTPSGDLMFGVMGQFAQWERQEIKKRTLAGRERRAKEGVQPARTFSPFGYKIVNTADVLRGEYAADQIGLYLILEDQATIVRELYTRYAAGQASIMGLTQWLNKEGVPTKTGVPHWHTSTVSYILNNPVYKGLGVFGRSDCWHDESRLGRVNRNNGHPIINTATKRLADPSTWITFPVPAIVSEEIWEAANARSEENRRKRSGNPSRVMMLSGHVYCIHCETGILKVVADKRPGYERAAQYMCGRHFRSLHSVGVGACAPTRYSLPVVEDAVVGAIEDGAHNPQNVRRVMRDFVAAFNHKDAKPDDGRDLARVEADLAALASKQSAAVKSQIAGVMAGADPAAYTVIFTEIAEQRSALEARREELTRTKPKPTAQPEYTATDFPRLFSEVRRVLTSPDVSGEEKRDAIGLIVSKVYPLKEGAKVLFLPGVFGAEDTIQRYRNYWATPTCERP